ncbi:MAG: hypothetical protein ACT4OZ_09105 [Gemmatimonadota bacterium]
MTRRLAIPLLAVSVILVALGYASAFVGTPQLLRAGEWCMALGIAGSATACLGFYQPPPGARRLVFSMALLATFVALIVGLAVPLALPRGTAATEVLVGGFPLRAALLIYIAGALPLIIMPAAYAWCFSPLPDARPHSDDLDRQ